jgi:hypothetical protein
VRDLRFGEINDVKRQAFICLPFRGCSICARRRMRIRVCVGIRICLLRAP